MIWELKLQMLGFLTEAFYEYYKSRISSNGYIVSDVSKNKYLDHLQFHFNKRRKALSYKIQPVASTNLLLDGLGVEICSAYTSTG